MIKKEVIYVKNDNPNKSFKNPDKPVVNAVKDSKNPCAEVCVTQPEELAPLGEKTIVESARILNNYKKVLATYSTNSKPKEMVSVNAESAKRSLDIFNKYYSNLNTIGSKVHNNTESSIDEHKDNMKLSDGSGFLWNRKLGKWVAATEDESGRPVEPNYNEDRDELARRADPDGLLDIWDE